MLRGMAGMVGAPLALALMVVVPEARRSLPVVLIVPAGATAAVAVQDTFCLARQSWPRDYFGGPVYTPYTRAPELRNRDEVRRALAREYPPALKSAGVGGTTLVWLHIDECGGVMGARVKQSSGRSEIDGAALRVAAMMRWTPAHRLEQPVSVWVAVPIIFRADASPVGVAPARPPVAPPPDSPPPPPPDVRACDAIQRPISRCEAEIGALLAPRDYHPLTLRNPGQIDELLKTLHPATTRAPDSGGTAWIRVRIDPDGSVSSAEVARGSGHDSLDAAALAVARALRFFPPRDLAGRYASVTIMAPIRF